MYLRKKVYPSTQDQPEYPILFHFARTLYIFKRGFSQLFHMEFSLITGKTGYFFWKTGVIYFIRRFILKQYKRPVEDDAITLIQEAGKPCPESAS